MTQAQIAMDQQTGHPPARLRVLLSSFAFSPFDGSEGGVGWETATRLARHHDVTVLCGDVSRKKPTKCALEKYFSIRPQIPGLTVQYIDPPVMAQFLEWLHRWPALWAFYWIAYQVWQRAACRVFHELHHREKFDVVHQLTYASYRAPGHLWRLPLPFFWGPVAGAAGVPMAFGTTLGLKELEVWPSQRGQLARTQPLLSSAAGRAHRTTRLGERKRGATGDRTLGRTHRVPA